MHFHHREKKKQKKHRDVVQKSGEAPSLSTVGQNYFPYFSCVHLFFLSFLLLRAVQSAAKIEMSSLQAWNPI